MAHSWLPAGEVAARFPGIAARAGERMLYQADSGVLLADQAVAALQRLAGRDGADIRPRTPVLGVEPRGDRVLLRTPAGGDIGAGGGDSGGRLVRGAAGRGGDPRPAADRDAAADPVLSPRAAGGDWPTLIDWSADGRAVWYAVPAAGGAPGVKVGAHAPGPAVDPGSGPFAEIDPAAEEAAARFVRERLPGLVPDGLGAETCLYTMTPDEHFVIDREGPVVVGGGGSGHAFKFGPLLGEMLADLALGRPTRVPRGRFALGRPGPAVRRSRLTAGESAPRRRSVSLSDQLREEHEVMFADTTAFSGFAVDDLEKAREFYGGTLGCGLRCSTAS